MKPVIFLLALLASGLVRADANQDAWSAGAGFGKGQASQGTSSLKNPGTVQGSIPGYTASPPETGYYGGVSGGDGGLNSKGQQALQNSGAGQAVIDAGTKNPLPVIDPKAPFITAGKNAEGAADNIVNGTGNPQQCQPGTVTKSVFDKYTCERDVWVNQSCKRSATVEVDGSGTTWETQTVEYEMSQQPVQEINGMNIVTIVPTVTGEIVRATYTWSDRLGNKPRFYMNISVLGAEIPWHNKGSAQDVAFTPVPATLTAGVAFTSKHQHSIHSGSGSQTFKNRHVQLKIALVIRVKKTSSVPKVVWRETCGFDKNGAVPVSSVCTVPGGNRPVVIDGETQQVYSDCWEYEDQYLQKTGSNGTCASLMNNPACTVTGTQCQTGTGAYCEHEVVNYECQRNFSSTGLICGGTYFCQSGNCSDTDGAGDSGFDTAVAKLAGLASAAADVKDDQINVKAFTGKAMSCRKAFAGFSNCCKDSGWGQDAGLSACNDDELALGKAKAKKITVSVGERCDHEVLGQCVQKSKVYCVFDGKLARIIQEQGRRDQLGVGFGSGSSPNCGGITVPQLQGIDFDRINFADFYEDLMANQKVPSSSVMVQQVKDRIAAQVKQTGGTK
mgnify:CR=1 FL=1